MPTMSPAMAAVTMPARSAKRKRTWSETPAESPAICRPRSPIVIFAAVYAPTAMKPAWPMENWPVKPFTTLSDTARMMLMPMSVRSLARKGPRAGTRTSCAAKARPTPTTRGKSPRGTVARTDGRSSRPRSARAVVMGLPLGRSPPPGGPVTEPPPAGRSSSHLLRRRGAEQARGAEQEDRDEQREHVDVAQVRRQVAGAEQLDHADEQAAQHGAAHVADAADHRGHEGLEAEEDPGGVRGLVEARVLHRVE